LYLASEGLGGDEASVGEDFATLVACNHTIQSYGSFSYFAGQLESSKHFS
jgi:hypothetical protein